jgi:hypothetical protein
MSALVGQDWRPKTLRELFVQYQAILLETWHHTAHLKGCWAGKGVRYEKLHPYIKCATDKIKVEGHPLFVTSGYNADGERISILKELRSAH